MIRSKIIENWGAIVLAIAALTLCLFKTSFALPGPDSKLYLGLGENLINGIGFFDTIRNDEILPTIGHPLIIAFSKLFKSNGMVFSYTMLGLAFIILSIYIKEATHKLISGIGIVILSLILPKLIEWSAELSLISSIMLFWTALIIHFKRRTKKTAIFLAISCFIFILIRPLLLPYTYIFLLLSSIGLLLNKSFRTIHLSSVVLLIGLLTSINLISKFQYGDSRLISGTYSAIPLYCAFNNDINLEQNYSSTRWRTEIKNDSLRNIATDILKLKDRSWKERDSELKSAVVQFVINNTETAIDGYLWRLSKYTYDSDSDNFIYLFYFWTAIVLTNIIIWFRKRRNTIWLLISVSIPIYIILIQSVFPYVGPRYLLVPTLFLFSGSIFGIHLAISANQNSDKVSP